MKSCKLFFGWHNIKWIIKEFFAMYSNQPSYFSKKRFESSIAFLSATGLILWHAYYTRDTITNSEVLANAVILFTVAGYTLNQIQAEKKEIISKTVTSKKPVAESTQDAPVKDDGDLMA